MKPRAASCAVGSELGFLFTFHESLKPVNPACEALGPMFYYTSDSPALQLALCLQSYRWTLCYIVIHRGGRPHCFNSRRGVSDYALKCEFMCGCLHVCLCPHIIWRAAIEWRDDLWSMSCRQNTSDLEKSKSRDGAGPFQATGAGVPLHKECSVSVRNPPRTPARASLSLTTPSLTNSTSSVCTHSEKPR